MLDEQVHTYLKRGAVSCFQRTKNDDGERAALPHVCVYLYVFWVSKMCCCPWILKRSHLYWCIYYSMTVDRNVMHYTMLHNMQWIILHQFSYFDKFQITDSGRYMTSMNWSMSIIFKMKYSCCSNKQQTELSDSISLRIRIRYFPIWINTWN